MTSALAVVLNVAAVAGLLVLLTLTMRLPYHFPIAPRAARANTRAEDGVQPSPQARPAGRRSSDRRDVPEPTYSQ